MTSRIFFRRIRIKFIKIYYKHVAAHYICTGKPHESALSLPVFELAGRLIFSQSFSSKRVIQAALAFWQNEKPDVSGWLNWRN